MKLTTRTDNDVHSPNKDITFIDEDGKVFYVMTNVLKENEGSPQERAERIVGEYMLAEIALTSGAGGGWTSGFAEKIIHRLNDLKTALMYILVSEARGQIIFKENKNGNTN